MEGTFTRCEVPFLIYDSLFVLSQKLLVFGKK